MLDRHWTLGRLAEDREHALGVSAIPSPKQVRVIDVLKNIHAERFAITGLPCTAVRILELCKKIEIPQMPEEILSDAAGCQQGFQCERQITLSRCLFWLGPKF